MSRYKIKSLRCNVQCNECSHGFAAVVLHGGDGYFRLTVVIKFNNVYKMLNRYHLKLVYSVSATIQLKTKKL